MSRDLALAAALVAAALLVPRAGAAQAFAAQAAVAQRPAVPGARPPLTRTTFDLGFVSTSGNASVRTLSLAEQFILQPGPWKFAQTFAFV